MEVELKKQRRRIFLESNRTPTFFSKQPEIIFVWKIFWSGRDQERKWRNEWSEVIIRFSWHQFFCFWRSSSRNQVPLFGWREKEGKRKKMGNHEFFASFLKIAFFFLWVFWLLGPLLLLPRSGRMEHSFISELRQRRRLLTSRWLRERRKEGPPESERERERLF